MSGRPGSSPAGERELRELAPLRQPLLQVVAVICSFGLPLLLLPSMIAADHSTEWLRSGLAGNNVLNLFVVDGFAPLRYALSDGRGIHRSTDGASWQDVNSGLPHDAWGRVETGVFAVDLVSPSVLYVSREPRGDTTLAAGLYVSDDAGATWVTCGQEMLGKQVQALALWSPSNGQPWGGGALPGDDGATSHSVVFAATSAGVYRSADRGVSWSRIDWRGVDTRILSLRVHPDNSDVMYIGTADSGLYWTEDGGSSWKAAETLGDHAVNDIRVVSTAPGRVYAATDAGVFSSSDMGRIWDRTEALANRTVNVVAPHPVDAGFVCAGLQAGGALCSSDGGRSWVTVLRGLGRRSVRCLHWEVRNPAVLWAGTTDGVWRYAFGPSEGPVVAPVDDRADTSRLAHSDTVTPTSGASIAETQRYVATAPASLASLTTVTATATSSTTTSSSPTATQTMPLTPIPTGMPTLTTRPTLAVTVLPSAPAPEVEPPSSTTAPAVTGAPTSPLR